MMSRVIREQQASTFSSLEPGMPRFLVEVDRHRCLSKEEIKIIAKDVPKNQFFNGLLCRKYHKLTAVALQNFVFHLIQQYMISYDKSVPPYAESSEFDELEQINSIVSDVKDANSDEIDNAISELLKSFSGDYTHDDLFHFCNNNPSTYEKQQTARYLIYVCAKVAVNYVREKMDWSLPNSAPADPTDFERKYRQEVEQYKDVEDPSEHYLMVQEENMFLTHTDNIINGTSDDKTPANCLSLYGWQLNHTPVNVFDHASEFDDFEFNALPARAGLSMKCNGSQPQYLCIHCPVRNLYLHGIDITIDLREYEPPICCFLAGLRVTAPRVIAPRAMTPRNQTGVTIHLGNTGLGSRFMAGSCIETTLTICNQGDSDIMVGPSFIIDSEVIGMLALEGEWDARLLNTYRMSLGGFSMVMRQTGDNSNLPYSFYYRRNREEAFISGIPSLGWDQCWLKSRFDDQKPLFLYTIGRSLRSNWMAQPQLCGLKDSWVSDHSHINKRDATIFIEYKTINTENITSLCVNWEIYGHVIFQNPNPNVYFSRLGAHTLRSTETRGNKIQIQSSPDEDDDWDLDDAKGFLQSSTVYGSVVIDLTTSLPAKSLAECTVWGDVVLFLRREFNKVNVLRAATIYGNLYIYTYESSSITIDKGFMRGCRVLKDIVIKASSQTFIQEMKPIVMAAKRYHYPWLTWDWDLLNECWIHFQNSALENVTQNEYVTKRSFMYIFRFLISATVEQMLPRPDETYMAIRLFEMIFILEQKTRIFVSPYECSNHSFIKVENVFALLLSMIPNEVEDGALQQVIPDRVRSNQIKLRPDFVERCWTESEDKIMKMKQKHVGCTESSIASEFLDDAQGQLSLFQDVSFQEAHNTLQVLKSVFDHQPLYYMNPFYAKTVLRNQIELRECNSTGLVVLDVLPNSYDLDTNVDTALSELFFGWNSRYQFKNTPAHQKYLEIYFPYDETNKRSALESTELPVAKAGEAARETLREAANKSFFKRHLMSKIINEWRMKKSKDNRNRKLKRNRRRDASQRRVRTANPSSPRATSSFSSGGHRRARRARVDNPKRVRTANPSSPGATSPFSSGGHRRTRRARVDNPKRVRTANPSSPGATSPFPSGGHRRASGARVDNPKRVRTANPSSPGATSPFSSGGHRRARGTRADNSLGQKRVRTANPSSPGATNPSSSGATSPSSSGGHRRARRTRAENPERVRTTNPPSPGATSSSSSGGHRRARRPRVDIPSDRRNATTPRLGSPSAASFTAPIPTSKKDRSLVEMPKKRSIEKKDESAPKRVHQTPFES